jgi:hypothetical protein
MNIMETATSGNDTVPSIDTQLGQLRKSLSVKQLWLIGWLLGCMLIRQMMVMTHLDGSNAGIIPALNHIFERFIDEDEEWNTASRNLPDDGIKIGSTSLNKQDLLRPVHGRLLVLWSILKWKRKYWFRPQVAPAGLTTCRRRTRYVRENEDRDQQGLEALLQRDRRDLKLIDVNHQYEFFESTSPRDDKALLLVYGRHLIYVQSDADKHFNHAQVDQDIKQLKCLKISRLSLLLLLASAGPAIAGGLQPGSSGLAYLIFLGCNLGIGFAIIVSSIMRGYKMTLAQKMFFGAVTRNCHRIEYIARRIKTQYAPERVTCEENRCIDVLLFYGDQKAWCRCQPTPDGPDDNMKNSWIELDIPSESKYTNAAVGVLDVWLHTLLPWGWINWVGGMVWTPVYHYVCVALDPWFGPLIFIAAVFCLAFGAGIPWLHALGETEIIWYMLLYRVLAGNQAFTAAWDVLYPLATMLIEQVKTYWAT